MSPGQPARATRIYANQQGPVKSHDLYLPNSAVHQTLGASARTPWLHARIWAHKGNARAKSTGQRPQMDARTQGFLVRTVPVGVWNRLLAVRHQRGKKSHTRRHLNSCRAGCALQGNPSLAGASWHAQQVITGTGNASVGPPPSRHVNRHEHRTSSHTAAGAQAQLRRCNLGSDDARSRRTPSRTPPWTELRPVTSPWPWEALGRTYGTSAGVAPLVHLDL